MSDASDPMKSANIQYPPGHDTKQGYKTNGFSVSLLSYVPSVLSCSAYLVSHVLFYLMCPVPSYLAYSCVSRGLYPACSSAQRASCNKCSRASRASCFTCLLPYVSSCFISPFYFCTPSASYLSYSLS